MEGFRLAPRDAVASDPIAFSSGVDIPACGFGRGKASSGEPKGKLRVVTVIAFDEFLNVRRHVAQLQVTATAQLLGDIFGNVLRPAFGSVEGNDPNGVSILAVEQVDDYRFKIGGLYIGFPIDSAIAAKIIDDQIDILIVATRYD
jgi:hypothetical protein